MRKSIFLTQHLIISTTILAVLLSIVLLLFSLIRDILINPKKYFLTDLSNTEVQFYIIYISIVVISVLVSYVVYLLLSSDTRTELVVLNATKLLEKSREQLERLYEEAPVPYMIIDEKGEIHKPNKAALRFFEVIAEEIEGKNIFHYQPEEDKDKVEKLSRYYKGNIPINREGVRMITKNGVIKWALLSIFEIKNPKDSGRTGLAVVFDITDQKKLDQAKTEFVSLASHQLRTPVATVKWYMDMLSSDNFGELSPKQKDYISRMYEVNEGMVDLIDTLLNVSRTEIGSIKVDWKPTNAIELAESILTELRSQIEEKRININKQYNDDLKNIKSDPKLLRIIIQNLISNAVKYTPEGGTVTINFKESFGEKTITVSDTGVGIPKGQQDKVFTKLFRADNVRNLVGSSGTGLGLYLIKSLLESMGGSIQFASEENKGSTFIVKF